jgi:hypothetical protein
MALGTEANTIAGPVSSGASIATSSGSVYAT